MPTPPDTSNIFGVTSNVNLTDIVKLNENPLDIPKDQYPFLGSWNAFQKYLQDNNIVRNPKYNKNQKDTDEIINTYNNSITNPNLKKITQDYIIAAQTFHKINDPKVQIDGWVGSQTSQLRYPNILVMFQGMKGDKFIPISDIGFIGIVWGNKRFVVKAETQKEYGNKGLFVPNTLYILYDENIHKDTLQTTSLQNIWYTIGQDTEISKNAAQLELQRGLEKTRTSASNKITDIKLKINTSKL